jgi:hypothetical protein
MRMVNYENILSYATQIKEKGFKICEGDKILFKRNKSIYELRLDLDIKSSQIKEISSSNDILAKVLTESDYNSIIICRPTYVGQIIDAGRTMTTVIDDYSMIGGYKTRIVNNNSNAISKAVHFGGSCMIKNSKKNNDGKAICCGFTLYEAFTCLSIMEKNAEIVVKSVALGGAKSINPIIGILERRNYKKYYSANERKSQNEIEGRA